MKKIFVFLLVIFLACSLVACGNNFAEDAKTKIGISMSSGSVSLSSIRESYIRDSFERAGFDVDLQFVDDNETDLQISQIEDMIANGCDVLVVAAVDGSSLTEVLASAAETGIAVFAFDRLITDTDAVTYYVSFDNAQIYREQALYIEKALDLRNAEGPFNIEIFTGDPGASSVSLYYQSAMEILQPYIDSGKVVVQSGQTSQMQTATANWSAQNAKDRMDLLISSVGYSPAGKTKLDAVLCSSDSIAQGCIEALTAAGWDATNIPVITGQGCEETNVNYIIQGLQAMSVYRDAQTLVDQTVKMVVQYLNGETVDVNDTETFHNGVKIVDAYLCNPVVYTKDNITKLADNAV